MQLDTRQIDALSEMINIGFGRAANALSLMADERVYIEIPLVKLYELHDLIDVISIDENQEVTSVVQVFTGRIDGLAVLVLDSTNTAALVHLLNGRAARPHRLSENDLDTLREIGNIVLSAFTSSFGNLLNIHIAFTVPHIRQQSFSKMIDTINIQNHELEYALMVQVQFRLEREDVQGFMLIVMGVPSLEALLSVMHAEGFI